jgi:hypothetical protein
MIVLHTHELRNEVVEELIPVLLGKSGANRERKRIRENKNSGMENEKGRREEKSGKEVRRMHSEKQTCPRRARRSERLVQAINDRPSELAKVAGTPHSLMVT